MTIIRGIEVQNNVESNDLVLPLTTLTLPSMLLPKKMGQMCNLLLLPPPPPISLILLTEDTHTSMHDSVQS